MRVVNQKNVYYIDLNKGIYRGYVETRLIRNVTENAVVYMSKNLKIESVSIIGEEVQPSFSYMYKNAFVSDSKETIQDTSNVVSQKQSFSFLPSASECMEDILPDNTTTNNKLSYVNFEEKSKSTKEGLLLEIDSQNVKNLDKKPSDLQDISYNKVEEANPNNFNNVLNTTYKVEEKKPSDFNNTAEDRKLNNSNNNTAMGVNPNNNDNSNNNTAEEGMATNNIISDSLNIKIPDNFHKEEFVLRIVYSSNPQNPFIQWYKQIGPSDKHKELIAYGSRNDSSGIAPYIDSTTDLELIYVIPNTEDVKLASSGQFQAIKEEDKNIIYLYKIFTHPRTLSFAVGSYEQIDIFNENDKKKMFSPSIDLDTSEVISDLQAIIRYIEGFVKSSLTVNVVFTLIDVDNLVASNMVILKASLIGTERDIEPCYAMKRILSDSLSFQVFGLYEWNLIDLWICKGFIGYLSDYCVRSILGSNEFYYNFIENKNYVIENDVFEPPLLYTSRRECDYDSTFFNIKSKLVFHCLESHLSHAFLQKIAEIILEIKKIEHESKVLCKSNEIKELNLWARMNEDKGSKECVNSDLKSGNNNIGSMNSELKEGNKNYNNNISSMNSELNIGNKNDFLNSELKDDTDTKGAIKNSTNLDPKGDSKSYSANKYSEFKNDADSKGADKNYGNSEFKSDTELKGDSKNIINSEFKNDTELKSDRRYTAVNRKCFTTRFIKIVKDTTGKDLKSFFDFYVFKPGLLKIKLQLQINKKKNTVKIEMSQTPTSLLYGSNKKYSSSINIKSYETEGIFDHQINIDGDNLLCYHTRPKKKKKEEGEEEEEEDAMTLLYLRADPKNECLFDFTIEQPDYMFIEQLNDKSVVGQIEAIKALKCKPTTVSCEALERLADNSHTFYKVRIRAIYAIRNINIDGFVGLQRLIQYFVRISCVPNSTVLKANEFGLVQYFIQFHLVRAISSLQNGSVDETNVIIAFLDNILKFNDNSSSSYDDHWYIASVISQYCLLLLHKFKLNKENYNFKSVKTFMPDFKLNVDKNTKIMDTNGEINTKSIETNNELNTKSIYTNTELSNKFTYTNPYELNNKLTGTNSELNNKFTELSSHNLNTNKFTEIGSELNNCTKPTGDSNKKLLKSFLEELERFRIMDIVFPSNNNIITSSCITSMIRLSHSNLLKINKDFLISLSKYPNIWRIRIVAIEGLLVLYPEYICIVIDMIVNESTFIIYNTLDIILTILSSDIKYERKHLYSQIDKIRKIYCKYYYDVRIKDKIEEIITYINNKDISYEEYKVECTRKFNMVREEENRTNLMKVTSNSKHVKLIKFDELRSKLIEEEQIIRIQKYKKPIVRIKKEPAKFNYKIRLKYSQFIPKNIDGVVFKLKLKEKKIKYKREDIPVLLVSKIREHHACAALDDFIRRCKPTNSFGWSPMTSKRILDTVKEGLSLRESYELLERMIVYVLSYTIINGKLYFSAKVAYNLLERTVYQYGFIPSQITPMTDDLRVKCEDFVDNLICNEAYQIFVSPVDYSELKNYIDIVRVPVCINDVKERMANYGSFESFVAELERIYKNCLNYNHIQSPIAKSAERMKEEIDSFKNSLILQKTDSVEVIKSIIQSSNVDGHFNPLLDRLRKIKTWGDFDNEINQIKRKYSRYSANGKICIQGTKEIKEKISYWFSADNNRVLFIVD